MSYERRLGRRLGPEATATIMLWSNLVCFILLAASPRRAMDTSRGGLARALTANLLCGWLAGWLAGWLFGPAQPAQYYQGHLVVPFCVQSFFHLLTRPPASCIIAHFALVSS